MITPSSILTYPLVGCLNQLADRSDQIKQRLQVHAGETICFRIHPFSDLYVAITQEGRFTAIENDTQTVVILDLPAGLLPRIASGDRDAFRSVIVSGSPTLADTLIYMGKTFQTEIEESLSSIIGDILARRVASAGQKWIGWHLDGAYAISQTLSEFLGEKQPVITNRTQFHQLASETSSLQQQLSRLEVRVARLVPSLSEITDHLPGADR